MSVEANPVTNPTGTSSGSLPSATTSSTTEQKPVESGFDAAAFEVDYALPAGSLANVTDKDAALAVVRQHADKVLAAGLAKKAATPPPKPIETAPPVEKTPAKPVEGESPEAARIRALEERERKREEAEAKRLEDEFAAMSAEVDRRADVEIDKWDSPTYGKSGSRTYNQIMAVQELSGLVRRHLAGLQVLEPDKPLPAIESLVRQVRAFHDRAPAPAAAEKPAAPLGAPGGVSSVAGNAEPSNIHLAVRRAW